MTTQSKLIRLFVLLSIILLYLSLPIDLTITPLDEFSYGIAAEERFIEDLSECTTGLASGFATPDGRPLLWKNRDVGTWEQEYHYVDNGGIPFISVTYADNTEEYYGGMNAAGFAIENSDAHNLHGRNPWNNGWGGDADDGETMAYALATCQTVDDFQDLLDSLNEDGRTDDFNYGTIDAYGGAAMFECDAHEYTRYDAADEPQGFLIRSNFAFSGADTAGDDAMSGNHRHDRAYQLWREAIENGYLTPLFIYQEVVRDLTTRDCNPLPLPFDGYYDSGWETWPYGHVPHTKAINRNRTRSIFVGHGVAEGERPDDGIIWAMTGSPLGCVMTPLWVRAGSVPVEYDAEDGCRLNIRAHEIRTWITEDGFGVDTWRLTNPEENGVYDFLLPLEVYLYNKTIRFVNSQNFNYDRLTAFQNEVAQEAADSLDAWRPVANVTEHFEAIYEENNIVLIWEEDEDQRFAGGAPRGYTVYRSPQPFRESTRGEELAFVEGTRFEDDTPLIGGGFYRVEIRY
ncbi:MAG: hypothetical protein P9X24_08635 [Candidatus Hatepunaea meridiana]|nr:hypothetical protein [Candidatus Hatepunaea meridiana]